LNPIRRPAVRAIGLPEEEIVEAVEEGTETADAEDDPIALHRPLRTPRLRCRDDALGRTYSRTPGLVLLLEKDGKRFDLLLGRRTYDAWSRFWPTAPKSPMADRLNAATKFVVRHEEWQSGL
jgi:hypothetical protein